MHFILTVLPNLCGHFSILVFTLSLHASDIILVLELVVFDDIEMLIRLHYLVFITINTVLMGITGNTAISVLPLILYITANRNVSWQLANTPYYAGVSWAL